MDNWKFLIAIWATIQWKKITKSTPLHKNKTNLTIQQLKCVAKLATLNNWKKHYFQPYFYKLIKSFLPTSIIQLDFKYVWYSFFMPTQNQRIVNP
jgi:hypothetical protein